MSGRSSLETKKDDPRPQLTVLVAEDDDVVRAEVVGTLTSWGARVIAASQESDAIERLAEHPGIVVVDVRLGSRGSGVRVAEAAVQLRPCPRLLAISGAATTVEAFRLAQVGVTGFLPKPFDLETFTAAFEDVLERTPSYIDVRVAQHVGMVSYTAMLETVRKAMLTQALAACRGNREQAGNLLRITRQAVQQMITSFELSPGGHPKRTSASDRRRS